MEGSRPDRRELGLAVAILAAAIATVVLALSVGVAQVGPETTPADLEVRNVTPHEVGEHDPDNRWANRAEFVEVGTDDNVSFWLDLRNNDEGCTEDPCPVNASVYVEATHQDGASASLTGQQCWDYAPPPTGWWEVATTGIQTTGPGDVVVEAHINDADTSDHCEHTTKEETNDPGKTNNVASFTVRAGEKPDLVAEGPVEWCWHQQPSYVEGEDSPPNVDDPRCPDGMRVDRDNTSAIRPYPAGAAASTYLRLNVENVGNYTDRTTMSEDQILWEAGDPPEGEGLDPDYEGIQGFDHLNPDESSYPAMDYEVNITARHNETGGVVDLSRADPTQWVVTYLGNVSSIPLDLSDLPTAGPFTATLEMDLPEDRLRERDETNNTRTFPFFVYAPDMISDIDQSTINTSKDNPYSYEGNTTIVVDGTVSNVGTLNATNATGWQAVVHPDEPDRRRVVGSGDIDPVYEAGNVTDISFTIDYCRPDPDQEPECALAPGNHTLELQVDHDDTVVEENEEDNADEVVFHTKDSKAPVVDDVSRQPSGSTVHLGENVTFWANVTEADPDFSNVTLNVGDPGGSVWHLDMDPDSVDQDGPEWNFTRTVTNLSEEGSYQWWVDGTDPTGNTFSTASTPGSFQVSEWPKNVSVVAPDEGLRIDWHNGTDSAEVRAIADINGTGWEPLNSTKGKFLNQTTPAGSTATFQLKSNWTDTEGCPPGESPGESNCDKDRFFQVLLYDKAGYEGEDGNFALPGRYNLTFAVKDKAGVWKENETYLDLQDHGPRVNADETTVDVSDGVDAGESFTVSANITDPDGHVYMDPGEKGMWAAFVNFTHVSGRSVNLTMFLSEGNNTESTWTRQVTTGQDGDLPWAGDYTYEIVGRDLPRNWGANVSDEAGFPTPVVTVFDNTHPTVEDAQADPPEEETNVNVTFSVVVSDNTAVDVDLNISQPDGASFCDVGDSCSFPMERVGETDLYQRTFSFADPGTYRWFVQAQDSAGHPESSSTQELLIERNRKPTVDVILPDAPDPELPGKYYSDPTVELVVSIQDPSDVQKDSISLNVDGNSVNVTDAMLSRAPSPPLAKPGWNLTYTLPSRYNDSAEIPVTIGATDGSAENKTLAANLKIVVDGAAPDVTLESFEPRYRAGGNVWNASKQTTFTLSGSDPGGDPSGIDAVRYQLEKESQGRPVTYTGPFTVNDTTPGWTGPGLYKFTYWSVDRAGNEGLHRSKLIRFDTAGPDITYFPKGRFVNASISDPQGVSQATIHYKSLDAETFTSEEMTFDSGSGLYKATLPDLDQGEQLEYFLSAKDLLLNQNIKVSDDGDPYVYEAGNTPPDISWETPSDGAELQGEFTFRWQASDPDPGQDLSYTLEYKLAGESKGAYEDLTPVTSTSVTYDTSRIPDGTYDIRVTANDGFSASRAVVTVVLENAEDAAVPNELQDTQFTLGEPVTFTTEVNQAPQSVTLVVTRDGEEVARIPMRDDGQPPDAQPDDNIYSASAQFNQSGEYSWHVAVSYERDGQTVTEESDTGQAFTVEATASQVFSQNLGLWVTIVVLTAAAAGLGWHALRKHQQGP